MQGTTLEVNTQQQELCAMEEHPSKSLQAVKLWIYKFFHDIAFFITLIDVPDTWVYTAEDAGITRQRSKCQQIYTERPNSLR